MGGLNERRASDLNKSRALSYLLMMILVLVPLLDEVLLRPMAQDVLHVAIDDGRFAAGREPAQLAGRPLGVSFAALAHFVNTRSWCS